MNLTAEWTTVDGKKSVIGFEHESNWRLNLTPHGENPVIRRTGNVIQILQQHPQVYSEQGIVTRPIIMGIEPVIDYSTFARPETKGKHHAISLANKKARFTVTFFPEHERKGPLSCGTITPVTVRFSIT